MAIIPPFLLAKNDLHVMKRILYDTGPQVVARWLCERVSKLRNSVLAKRPHTLKMGGRSLFYKAIYAISSVLAYVFLSENSLSVVNSPFSFS